MNFFSKFFNRTKPESLRVSRVNRGFSGGTLIDEESAMTIAAYHRGVIYLSSQLAKLPVDIKDKSNKLLENDIWYLLNVSPNREMTSMTLKLFLFQCAINSGEGYAEIERTLDGRAKALWPLNPRKIDPYRLPDGELVYQIAQGGKNGETIYLPVEDVLVFKNLHTKDGIRGLGTIAYALDSLGISKGADKFSNSLFANGAMPSGVLSHPGVLSDAAHKRLLESWKEQTGGRKTGATALLEEGVTYNPISHDPEALQFIETRKFGVVEIARFLGVPPIKLFDLDSAKYGNMEQVQLEVATDVLDAWARNIESEIDMKLLRGRRAGMRSEMDLYATFRGDMSTRSQYFQRMMQSSAMTPNEIREREGMSPYDGGDRYYIATNNFSPVDRLDEIVDKQVEPAPKPAQQSANPVDEAVAKYIETKIKN